MIMRRREQIRGSVQLELKMKLLAGNRCFGSSVASFMACLTGLLVLGSNMARADEPSGQVTVKRILVHGRPMARTDAAVQVHDGRSADLVRGDRLDAGTVVKVMFPSVRVYLDDGTGRRIMLTCTRCTEELPASLEIGAVGTQQPYKQEGGEVHYLIEPGEGWFEILFDALLGPEEELVPVAVKGTRFLLESGAGGFAIVVAEGTVAVGRPGEPQYRKLGAGKTLTKKEGELDEQPADPGVLQYMKEVFAPPVVGPAPPSESSWTASVPWPWVTVGAGAAIVATGGVFHYLAWDANQTLQRDANDRCAAGGGGAAGAGGSETGQEYYDRKYDEDVRPKRTAAWLLYAAGGAVAAGGIAWLLLEPAPPAEPAAGSRSSTPDLVPVLGPDSLGLQIQLLF